MSFAQQRLWILDQLEPQQSFLQYTGAVRMKGDLEMESLQWRIMNWWDGTKICALHFHMTEAGPMQVIAACNQVQ